MFTYVRKTHIFHSIHLSIPGTSDPTARGGTSSPPPTPGAACSCGPSSFCFWRLLPVCARSSAGASAACVQRDEGQHCLMLQQCFTRSHIYMPYTLLKFAGLVGSSSMFIEMRKIYNSYTSKFCTKMTLGTLMSVSDRLFHLHKSMTVFLPMMVQTSLHSLNSLLFAKVAKVTHPVRISQVESCRTLIDQWKL